MSSSGIRKTSKYRANLFKHLFFCFILWFTSSWPFRFTDDFLQVLLYWSRSTTRRSGTTQRFVAVDLLIFYILVFYACSGDLFARFQALAGCWFPLTKTPRVPETFHARKICLRPTPKHQAAREEKKLWYPGWQRHISTTQAEVKDRLEPSWALHPSSNESFRLVFDFPFVWVSARVKL